MYVSKRGVNGHLCFLCEPTQSGPKSDYAQTGQVKMGPKPLLPQGDYQALALNLE